MIRQDGDTLFITGDEAANRIAIMDEGRAGVHVTCDGDRPLTFTGIREIQAAGGDGYDTVQLQRSTADSSLAVVNVDLGSGVKSGWFYEVDFTPPPSGIFHFTATQPELAGGELVIVDSPTGIHTILDRNHVNMIGNARDDQITATLTPITTVPDVSIDLGGGNDDLTFVVARPPLPIPPPDPGPPVVFDIRTGAGNDVVRGDSSAINDIVTNWHVELGAGHDAFTANFSPTDMSPAPSDLPPVPCKLDVFGQQGNDHLSLFLRDPETSRQPQLFNTALTANLDGGGGDDTALIDITNVVVNAPMSLTYNGGPGDEVLGWDWRDVTVNAPVTQSMNLGGGGDNAMIIYGNVAFNADAMTNVTGGLDPDTIYVTFGGTTVAAGASLAVNADGGGGADTIAQTWWATTVAPGASVMVDVDGGGGRDVFSMNAIGGTVARDARFDVEVHGGAGADVLRLSTVGLLVDGTFSCCLDGGGADDVIDARLDLDANSRGTADVEVMGSAGDDLLGLTAEGIVAPSTFKLW